MVHAYVWKPLLGLWDPQTRQKTLPSTPILFPFSLQPVGAGCQVFEGRPKLAAWRQRVEAAVGEDLFQEAHEVIMKAKESPPADPTVKQKLMPVVLAMIG